MRLRVEVAVKETLVHFITIFSKKLQKTESFAVMYKKLPLYCFSCGLIGHTTLVCSCPADRDDEGELPYSAKRLLVDEMIKKSSSRSGTNASSTGGGN